MRHSTFSRSALTGVLLLSAVSLGGCVNSGYGDIPAEPLSPYERYPIAIKKGGVTLEVPASGSLSAANEDKVLRLGQLAGGNSAGSVIVSRPAGRGASVAGEVTRALVRGGVPAGGIVHRTHRGRSSVMISYTRAYAATLPCGNWTRDLTAQNDNEVYENFGCAQQHNIAAMVSDPEDLAIPATQTPSDAMRRQQVFTDYRAPKNTATPEDSQATAVIADVAK